MELRRTKRKRIAGLRAARLQTIEIPIVPGFYAGLVEQAEPFLIVDAPGVIGYALLLGQEHDGHVHTTLVELGLDRGHEDRYEDVLDALREKAKPTAYLVRTDDCRLNASLLARGLQVEATALVMVLEESRGAAAFRPAPPGHDLVPLRPVHLPDIERLLFPDGPATDRAPAGPEGPAANGKDEEETGHDHHRPDPAATLDEVRVMAETGEGWVLLEDGRPQAVVARLATEDGAFELVDFVLAQGEEVGLSWAIAGAAAAVRAAGRRPAAVIDALDPVRRRILRDAGFYTAAAYLVFYDPIAGRPSVPTVSLDELRRMMRRKEKFHLVDVMGEEHWKAGHLPGSEWIDFRGLGREARRRYKQDETIVVYCNGFT